MSADLRTPLKTVRGLGSAQGGTGHFVIQRITAVALAVLSLWFVWLCLALFHADYAAAHALAARPCNAVLLAAFVVALFWHAQLGLQVVIEDYVHTPWLEVALQILVKLLAVLGALASLFALVRIALGS
jgi:succinate dehydrogenase / fumarate reductase membrane anchor subunit